MVFTAPFNRLRQRNLLTYSRSAGRDLRFGWNGIHARHLKHVTVFRVAVFLMSSWVLVLDDPFCRLALHQFASQFVAGDGRLERVRFIYFSKQRQLDISLIIYV